MPVHFCNRSYPILSVISRGFPINWPPRSPDMTPLDYYFWGTAKNRVYDGGRPSSIDQLKVRIRKVISEISQEEICAAVQNILTRAEMVKDVNGAAFEHLK